MVALAVFAAGGALCFSKPTPPTKIASATKRLRFRKSKWDFYH
jgi:hypothetical protein